jgi:hypothetical protein
MRTIHTEIGIGAPAEIVWEVVSDLEGWSAWNPFLKASGKLAGGETLRVTIAAPGGKAHRIEPAVVLFDDGHEFRWKMRSFGGMLRAEHGFRVVPEDVGRCRFEQFEMFGGFLAGAFLSRQGKALETGFQAMNRMLKREAEKRARERA